MCMNTINRCKALLGTYVEMNISGDFLDDDLLNMSQGIFLRIEEIENLMSFHKYDSELSYINSNAYHQSCSISNEMYDVLKQALVISELTNGLYDISIGSELVKNGFLPDRSIKSDNSANFRDISLGDNKVKFSKRLQIDLGGIAKGYAVDQALLTIKNKDVKVVINAGGDLIMNDWIHKSIDIKVPSLASNKMVNIKMKNKAVATSASYYFDNNKNPIVSPNTKRMVDDKRSVSVFAPNCMLADALTKVAFLDKNYMSLIKSLDAEVIFVNEFGDVC
ncbi:MAG: thiamine biosynthesis lipoprotein [Rickettsiales bacterium]|jgi:thiamine biosynthesis lipoprotein